MYRNVQMTKMFECSDPYTLAEGFSQKFATQ